MTDSQIRVDIRQNTSRSELRPDFYWVLQSTAPVTNLARSWGEFATRAEALADFQRVCEALGWKNDITTVPVR